MLNNTFLHARPGQTRSPARIGIHSLGVGNTRDSYLYVPHSYDPDSACPMVVLLHGSGGHARHGLELMQDLADDYNLILLAPASYNYTWDIIAEGAYGTDVTIIDQALHHVFGMYSIETSHVGIGGFSDGASYALSLGFANGILFTHVLAFSPGFIAPVATRGKPAIFISHGTKDDVLPIAHCSRRIVPSLEQESYHVVYREFDGPHTIPPQIAVDAVRWFLQSSTGRQIQQDRDVTI